MFILLCNKNQVSIYIIYKKYIYKNEVSIYIIYKKYIYKN